MGTLRAGCVAAPLAPSSTPESLAAMVADCGAPIVFVDGDNAAAIAGQDIAAKQIRLDTQEFHDWLAPEGAKPAPVTIQPEHGFNIIYSSGTTGRSPGPRSHRCVGAIGPAIPGTLAPPIWSRSLRSGQALGWSGVAGHVRRRVPEHAGRRAFAPRRRSPTGPDVPTGTPVTQVLSLTCGGSAPGHRVASTHAPNGAFGRALATPMAPSGASPPAGRHLRRAVTSGGRAPVADRLPFSPARPVRLRSALQPPIGDREADLCQQCC